MNWRYILIAEAVSGASVVRALEEMLDLAPGSGLVGLLGGVDEHLRGDETCLVRLWEAQGDFALAGDLHVEPLPELGGAEEQELLRRLAAGLGSSIAVDWEGPDDVPGEIMLFHPDGRMEPGMLDPEIEEPEFRILRGGSGADAWEPASDVLVPAGRKRPAATGGD